MEITSVRQSFQENFPLLSEPDLIDEIVREGEYREYNAGEILINHGSYIKSIPLVLEGTIKVLREDNSDKELFLYYLKPGETCAMSLTCCIANQKSEITATAEDDSKVIMIPVRFMDLWTAKYVSWKNMVMTTYHKRFNELLNAIDGIAFTKLDERLINYLIEKNKNTQLNIINLSHQEIARELGTQREVISRLLKKMENDGMVKLGRNKIELLDVSLINAT